jgi:hypothetical protein
MAIIRRTTPEAKTAVVKGPRAQATDVVSSGLGVIQRGLSIGKAVTGLVAQNIDQANTTEAEDAVNRFEREKNELFFNPENGYFNTQGRSAYDMSEDANKSLQKLARTHADAMSNPAARDMFMRVANRHITSGQNDINRHASKGLNAWEITTIKAQTENTLENGALLRLKVNPTQEDITKLNVQRELGRQSVRDRAKIEGITGTALNEELQTYDSAFASSTISASILDNSDAGKTALDKYGDMLEGDLKVKFENKLQKKIDEENTQKTSQQGVMIASRLVGVHDGNRAAVLEDISKIEDPETQSKARKEAMYQINQLETAKVEERNDIVEQVEKFTAESGSAEAYKAAYPEQWQKLSPKQQRQLEKGEPTVNDWNTWHDVMSMSDAEIRNMKPEEVERNASKLDRYHRDKLYTMWRSTRSTKAVRPESQVGRTRAAQSKSAIEQLMNKKSAKWSTQDKAKSDKFYALVDSEARHREEVTGKPLSSEEFTGMLNDLTRRVTIEKKFWPDPELGIGDIPEEDLGALTNHLRKNKIPITADNLLRAYEQAK